jgi:ABC-type glycerol-3-phosphate transport system substrate-binding protein
MEVIIMKGLNRILCAALSALLLLSLCACGKKDAEESGGSEAVQQGYTIPGYRPEPVQCPGWFDDMGIFMKYDVDGDFIWFGGSEDGTARLARFNTMNESWQEFPIDTAEAGNVRMQSMSVKDGFVWALLEEHPTEEEYDSGNFKSSYSSFVYFMDTASGEQSCARLDFEGDAGTESSSPVLSGIVALDGNRVLIYTPESAYLTDREAAFLADTGLPGGSGNGFKINDTLYIYSGDSIAPLDTEAVSLGTPLPYDIYGNISSNAGNIYTIQKQAVCLMDMQTGTAEELFKSMDVAVSVNDVSFYGGFENSQGVLYKIGGENGLVKIAKTQLPLKKPLTLACFGYTGGEYYDAGQSMGWSDYDINRDLLDAVIRFNNTDPEYKVVIKPQLYADDAERNRLLIELATSSNIDLLDTSFLPESAIDAGVLVDMLPLIDADDDLSRDDFIEPLLKLMTADGGLYEYTAKFTMLTMTTRSGLFPGRDKWTVAEMERIMADNPDKPPLPPWQREGISKMLIWAMSAEFIDRENNTCSFDSGKFINWLRLLSDLPQGEPEDYEAKGLFGMHFDLASDAGFWCRDALGTDDYTVCGFPDSEGSGSYFLRLGSKISDFSYTEGSNVRIGMMASGKNQEGAWRFVKTLMQGGSGSSGEGISVFKESFESGLDKAVELYADDKKYSFTQSDADKLREQVYGTDRMVFDDERILSTISTELNAYLGGKYTAKECASQIQSKLSIYLAEQG